MITQTCTAHCRCCGRHFHGDHAFDHHRQFVDPKSPRWDERECIDPDQDPKMERWTESGMCKISGDHKTNVVIYRMVMTEAQKRSIHKFQTARQTNAPEPSQ